MVSHKLLCELPNLAVLLIDGRSGAGKTSLADRILAALALAGRESEVLRVEDLYPGWDGLSAGSTAVAAALAEGSYRRYDWITGAFAETRAIAPCAPLVIEGCGAITRANLGAAARWVERWPSQGAPAAVRSVWLDEAETVRRSRALERDGSTYDPHWKRWAAQESAHFATHQPWLLADFVFKGIGADTDSGCSGER